MDLLTSNALTIDHLNFPSRIGILWRDYQKLQVQASQIKLLSWLGMAIKGIKL